MFTKQSIKTAVFCMCLCSYAARAQQSGQTIYEKAQNAVFLIYVNDSSGQTIAQGSGFLIATHKIATNAHVANAGNLVIAIGPARIPAKVDSVDSKQDLAILDINIDLDASPLILQPQIPSVGEDVYTIGSPKGLEKTFSTGVVSGLRHLDGRDLIQITTPISHGSSGGPVLNSKGEVIGLATAMLDEGQNLNFAVSAKALQNLLAHPLPTHTDPATALASAQSLIKERENIPYATDDSSPYQLKSKQIIVLLNQVLDSSDANLLLSLSTLSQSEDFDLAIAAARKSLQIHPSAESRVVLADALVTKCSYVPDKANCPTMLSEASTLAEKGLSEQKVANSYTLSTLAFAKALQNEPQQATVLLQRALSAPSVEHSPTRGTMLRSLIANATAAGNDKLASQVFPKFVETGEVSISDWEDEAYRRVSAGDSSGAADDFAKAASLMDSNSVLARDGIDWCRAAIELSLKATDLDQLLSDGRKCLSKEAAYRSKDIKDLDAALATVNTALANTLNTRGVYSEALNYAREAVSIAPNSAEAFDALGDATFNLQRYKETVTAEQEAIRLSDGKYGYMHFRLGTAYFALEEWAPAEREFEIVANKNTDDYVSAYNAGLSLGRQGYYSDEAKWLKIALARHPSPTDLDSITGILAQLGAR